MYVVDIYVFPKTEVGYLLTRGRRNHFLALQMDINFALTKSLDILNDSGSRPIDNKSNHRIHMI